MNNHPIPLKPNYAWRSYQGGSQLRSFRNQDAGIDDHFPEDWIASTSRARNGDHQQRSDEGVSYVTVEGKELPLTQLLASKSDWFWGSQEPPNSDPEQIGVLIKLLDSGVRLHLQAHPDREFVKKRFGGNAGKTECWYILSTRDDDAYVLLGFQHPPSPAKWADMVASQDLEGMRACFEKIPVKPGDCLMVPAGTPHAIGEGIFMIELQEPTDWVVRCEFSAGGHVLEPSARFMGLELEEVMEVFDFTQYPLETIKDTLQQSPNVLRASGSFVEEEIIESKHQSFFRLRRLSGDEGANWPGGEPMILIQLQGSGLLNGTPVCEGESWLLPGSIHDWDWQPSANDWTLLLAQPPRKR